MSATSLLPFLAYLPDVHFCDTDVSEVEAAVFASFESITGRTLYPGNPERLFCEAMAAVIAMQRVVVDESARGQLLAYAAGDVLDHLGALVGVRRLAASAAVDRLRVELAAVQAGAWTAPQGTRVSPDGQRLFATDEALIIPAGETAGEVAITCLTAGTIGNGFAPGQIARLVDPLPYVAGLRNLAGSSGGAEVEDDERLRNRIHLAPASYSVAGPSDAYRYWALSAHQDILDVAVYSPAPVEVEVYPLLTGGVIPDQGMLDLLTAALDRKDRVPLTDRITVKAPVGAPCTVDMTWWLATDQAVALTLTTQAVAAAVASWVQWQTRTIGRDIIPSELVRLVQAAGVKRVEVASPVHTTLQPWEVARVDAVSVTFGGMEG